MRLPISSTVCSYEKIMIGQYEENLSFSYAFSFSFSFPFSLWWSLRSTGVEEEDTPERKKKKESFASKECRCTSQHTTSTQVLPTTHTATRLKSLTFPRLCQVICLEASSWLLITLFVCFPIKLYKFLPNFLRRFQSSTSKYLPVFIYDVNKYKYIESTQQSVPRPSSLLLERYQQKRVPILIHSL